MWYAYARVSRHTKLVSAKPGATTTSSPSSPLALVCVCARAPLARPLATQYNKQAHPFDLDLVNVTRDAATHRPNWGENLRKKLACRRARLRPRCSHSIGPAGRPLGPGRRPSARAQKRRPWRGPISLSRLASRGPWPARAHPPTAHTHGPPMNSRAPLAQLCSGAPPRATLHDNFANVTFARARITAHAHRLCLASGAPPALGTWALGTRAPLPWRRHSKLGAPVVLRQAGAPPPPGASTSGPRQLTRPSCARRPAAGQLFALGGPPRCCRCRAGVRLGARPISSSSPAQHKSRAHTPAPPPRLNILAHLTCWRPDTARPLDI